MSKPTKRAMDLAVTCHRIAACGISQDKDYVLSIAREIDREFGLAPPAPATDEPLQVGERVWVSNPEGLFGSPRIEGWGRVLCFYADTLTDPYVTLVFDEPWCLARDGIKITHWAVLRAACHREGPQDPPPAEGAGFLGRVDIPGGRDDAWWLPEARAVHIHGCAWSVDIITAHLRFARTGWRPCYIDALAVARELGLVDAEPEAKPEPRPEQKFVKGQWLEPKHGGHHAMPVVACGWSHVWQKPHYQFQAGCDWFSESDFRPHAMTLADVPPDVWVNIGTHRPVQVIDVPIGPDGRPLTAGNDYNHRGQVVHPLASHRDVVTVMSHDYAWYAFPWNLGLVKDTPDA